MMDILLVKLANFLEISLYLMIIFAVLFVVAALIYDWRETLIRKKTDPIDYEDQKRELDFLAEVQLYSFNM